VVRRRHRWRVWQRYMDAAHFLFLDETSAATNMVRRYGRCPAGQRLVAAVPYGHWKTTTFIAGLRQSGIVAPLVLDGPMTGKAFRTYVEQCLAPALGPGDVVVLDNLAAHKVKGIQDAVATVGAHLLYLPPYSPDLNPIEMAFAKLKALLRKSAARTRHQLWTTIGELIPAVAPAECASYLRHCGYGAT
jgi:transposase